jgi:hypothetical protein
VTVTLAPGRSAATWFTFSHGDCVKPTTVLRILLSGAGAPLMFDNAFPLCPGEMVWASTLHAAGLPDGTFYGSNQGSSP